MDIATQEKFASRARIIKAMGHPSRLFIVDRLAAGDLCVGDLQALVEADMSTVSRHLSVLREAGIIHSRKEGNLVVYSLRCPCVLSFFDCVESVLQITGGQPVDLLERR